MYGKLLIRCDMEVLTGLHIGGFSTFSAIGAVDSVVVRDALTGMPMVPGSSLKGKLRTLLAKADVCDYILKECNGDPPEIKRLFGKSAEVRKDERSAARLQFADCFLKNAEELKRRSGVTEIKYENTINRYTAVANPRQIERVVRGAIFLVKIIYDIHEVSEVEEDFENIAKAFRLLSMDYLGGHGSRGYGKVRFLNFDLDRCHGDFEMNLEGLKEKLREVESHAVFAV